MKPYTHTFEGFLEKRMVFNNGEGFNEIFDYQKETPSNIARQTTEQLQQSQDKMLTQPSQVPVEIAYKATGNEIPENNYPQKTIEKIAGYNLASYHMPKDMAVTDNFPEALTDDFPEALRVLNLVASYVPPEERHKIVNGNEYLPEIAQAVLMNIHKDPKSSAFNAINDHISLAAAEKARSLYVADKNENGQIDSSYYTVPRATIGPFSFGKKHIPVSNAGDSSVAQGNIVQEGNMFTDTGVKQSIFGGVPENENHQISQELYYAGRAALEAELNDDNNSSNGSNNWGEEIGFTPYNKARNTLNRNNFSEIARMGYKVLGEKEGNLRAMGAAVNNLVKGNENTSGISIPEGIQKLNPSEKEAFLSALQNGCFTNQRFNQMAEAGGIGIIIENASMKDIDVPQDEVERSIEKIVSTGDWKMIEEKITVDNSSTLVKTENNGKVITYTYEDKTITIKETTEGRVITTTTNERVTTTTYKKNSPPQKVHFVLPASLDLGGGNSLSAANILNPKDFGIALRHTFEGGSSVWADTKGNVGGTLRTEFEGGSAYFGADMGLVDQFTQGGVNIVAGTELESQEWKTKFEAGMKNGDIASLKMGLERNLGNPNSLINRNLKEKYNELYHNDNAVIQYWQSRGTPAHNPPTTGERQSAAYDLATKAMSKGLFKLYGAEASLTPSSLGVMLKFVYGVERQQRIMGIDPKILSSLENKYLQMAANGQLDNRELLNKKLSIEDFCENGMCRILPKNILTDFQNKGYQKVRIFGKGGIPSSLESIPQEQFGEKPPLLVVRNGNDGVPVIDVSDEFGMGQDVAFGYEYNPTTNQAQIIPNVNEFYAANCTVPSQNNSASLLGENTVETGRGVHTIAPQEINEAVLSEMDAVRDSMVQKMKTNPGLKKMIMDFEGTSLNAFSNSTSDEFKQSVERIRKTFNISTSLSDNALATVAFKARMKASGKEDFESRINYAQSSGFITQAEKMTGEANILQLLQSGTESFRLRGGSGGIANRFDRNDTSIDHAYEAGGIQLVKASRKETEMTDPRTGKTEKCYLVTGFIEECNNAFVGFEPFSQEEYVNTKKEYTGAIIEGYDATYYDYVHQFKTFSLNILGLQGVPTISKEVSTIVNPTIDTQNEIRNNSETYSHTLIRTRTETPTPPPPPPETPPPTLPETPPPPPPPGPRKGEPPKPIAPGQPGGPLQPGQPGGPTIPVEPPAPGIPGSPNPIPPGSNPLPPNYTPEQPPPPPTPAPPTAPVAPVQPPAVPPSVPVPITVTPEGPVVTPPVIAPPAPPAAPAPIGNVTVTPVVQAPPPVMQPPTGFAAVFPGQ